MELQSTEKLRLEQPLRIIHSNQSAQHKVAQDHVPSGFEYLQGQRP